LLTPRGAFLDRGAEETFRKNVNTTGEMFFAGYITLLVWTPTGVLFIITSKAREKGFEQVVPRFKRKRKPQVKMLRWDTLYKEGAPLSLDKLGFYAVFF
jgi:hypothetical protein